MALSSSQDYLTLPYKFVDIDGGSIKLDIYPPNVLDSTSKEQPLPSPLPIPAVVYFHGGGLTVGNRTSWLPIWLKTRITAAGYAFISADYRLLSPPTGHDILTDIKDLFVFLSRDLNSRLDVAFESESCSRFPKFHVDGNAIAVAGSSAGGLCAYLAAMHAKPKPKAVVSMYAMGGHFLTPHYLSLKSKPFFRGREILDPALFSEYFYPFPRDLKIVTDSPLSYHPASSPTPGYPANSRMLLARLYIQLGVFLDYYTGEHESSISARLGASLGTALKDSPMGYLDLTTEKLLQLTPKRHHLLFPQLGVTSDWPPTFLCHGALDTAVPVHESRNMKRLLEEAGVPVKLDVFDGKEHSFDYDLGADEMYGARFDAVGEFLKECLDSNSK